MPIFYKIASMMGGNCDINNLLPVRRNKGRSVVSIHYVQSVSHNEVKQGLTPVVDVRTSPGGVMRVCITADDEVSSFGPAAHHQPIQLLGTWKFDVTKFSTLSTMSMITLNSKYLKK
jgi:hypothetical protein